MKASILLLAALALFGLNSYADPNDPPGTDDDYYHEPTRPGSCVKETAWEFVNRRSDCRRLYNRMNHLALQRCEARFGYCEQSYNRSYYDYNQGGECYVEAFACRY